METKSGSFPPNMVSEIHSESHMWIRDHLEILKQKDLDIKYRELNSHEIPELKALQMELFPIQYSDSLYESINQSIFSIGAFLYNKYYEEGAVPLLVGVILFRITPNANNDYLRWSYMFSTTYSAYIVTIGVIEELRGRGIAKTLITMCKQICREYTPLPLYISLHVAEYNEEAIPFYEKLNFEMAEHLDSHYFIDGSYYGAFLYIYFFPEAKRPILSWGSLFKSTKNLFKVPKCFNLFS
jgi:ribosomal protein S18 acetylase RimI-like enzyme